MTIKMLRILTQLFRDYFGRNRGSDSAPVHYGVQVTHAADDVSEVTVRVTFKRAKSYCCTEPGCHFGPNWQRLRAVALGHGVRLPIPFAVRLHCVVEPGSLCTVTGGRRDRIVNAAQEYHQVYTDTGERG